MLDKPKYRSDWEWKKQWYLDNGYVEGETLFTTEDDPRGRARLDEGQSRRGSDR